MFGSARIILSFHFLMRFLSLLLVFPAGINCEGSEKRGGTEGGKKKTQSRQNFTFWIVYKC